MRYCFYLSLVGVEFGEPGLGAGVLLQDALAGVERGGHHSRPKKAKDGREAGWSGGKGEC